MLEELETSVFNDHVTALVTRISEKPKELITETFQHWNEIGTEQLQFRRGKNTANTGAPKPNLTGFAILFLKVLSKLNIYNL